MPADDPIAPTSPEEAERRRHQLTLDVQSIQAQLGDKQRTDEQGRRLSQKEYWAWRKRAQHSLNKKLDELRLVKAFLREHRRQRHLGPDGALAHLRELYFLAVDIQKRVNLSDLEMRKIDAAGLFLNRIDNPKENLNASRTEESPGHARQRQREEQGRASRQSDDAQEHE